MLRACIFGSIVTEPEEQGSFAERARDFDLTDRPAMAALHEVCGGSGFLDSGIS